MKTFNLCELRSSCIQGGALAPAAAAPPPPPQQHQPGSSVIPALLAVLFFPGRVAVQAGVRWRACLSWAGGHE